MGSSVWQDLRYGARILRKRSGFTLVAVIALALGIGASTAIFSVADAVLWRPLPFPDPSRLVVAWEKNPAQNEDRAFVATGTFLDWKDRNRVFESLAAVRDVRFTLTGGGVPEEIDGQRVSAGLFPCLGVQPLLGRGFRAEEDQPGATGVAVLSHSLWTRRFAADPAIVGRRIEVDHQPHTVIGVMPPDFQVTNRQARLWTPLGLNRAENYTARYLVVLARLRPGISLAQARAGMEELARGLERENPARNAGWSVTVLTLQEELVGAVRPALVALLGAVACLLLIACANVANLLLARASTRRKEIAIRAALGAGRGRVARQLLTESALLGTLGGALGLALALGAIRLVARFGPHSIPRLAQVKPDAAVLGFTLLISLATGILFGLAPALQASRTELGGALKAGGRGSRADRSGRRLRGLLVIWEIALAVVLLIGAGLLLRSFERLQAARLGFDPRRVLTIRVQLSGARHATPDARAEFFDRAAGSVAALPGVTAAGAVNTLPLGGLGGGTTFVAEGHPVAAGGDKPVALVRAAQPDYFRAMRIPLLQGRLFNARDTGESPRVVLVNETLARRFWPGGDALGKRLVMDWRTVVSAEIVGVVADVKAEGPAAAAWPTIYAPHRQLADPSMTLVIRTATSDPRALAAAASRCVWALDAGQPVSDVRTMDEVLSASEAGPRFQTLLFAVFASVALALAAVGVYGVIACGVSERAHEIGMRMALGAQRGAVLRMVLRQGAGLAAAGIIVGVSFALVLARWMASLLFEVRPTDALTFSVIAFALWVVALGASVLPARAAARVDPMAALREE